MNLLPCEWFACTDAPAAPDGANLTDLRHNGTEVYDYGTTGDYSLILKYPRISKLLYIFHSKSVHVTTGSVALPEPWVILSLKLRHRV